MAGIRKYRHVQDLDGISFVPMLKNPTAKAGSGQERPLFWHFPNWWGPTGPGIGSTSTVRKGDWKLIYYHQNRHMELFNIRDDIGESHNLAPEKPEITREMAKILGNYLRSVDAQMPTDKSTGKAVPWPDQQ
jgi:arylsulfatase A-like enzyme